jgi:hypothetical protein
MGFWQHYRGVYGDGETGAQGAREGALGALMPMSPNERKPIMEMPDGGDAIQSSLF